MREKLEKKIFEKPDDLARHEEFVAWLRDNDDAPRADLIEAHIALENENLGRDRRFELEAEARALLSQHGREWIGELSDFILLKPTLERPFELPCGIHFCF